MVVAGLLGNFTRNQPARGLEVEHEDLCLQKGGMHPLPPARRLALVESEQDGLCQQQPGCEVSDWYTYTDRTLARQTRDRHQPAETLCDLIDTGTGGVGTCLAKARDAAIHDARIDLRHRLIVDAKSMLHVRAVVLDHDVGLFRQFEKDVAPFRRLQVERHGALVPVQVLEVETVSVAAYDITMRRAGWLDLDDLGAPVSQLAHRGR